MDDRLLTFILVLIIKNQYLILNRKILNKQKNFLWFIYSKHFGKQLPVILSIGNTIINIFKRNYLTTNLSKMKL